MDRGAYRGLIARVVERLRLDSSIIARELIAVPRNRERGRRGGADRPPLTLSQILPMIINEGDHHSLFQPPPKFACFAENGKTS